MVNPMLTPSPSRSSRLLVGVLLLLTLTLGGPVRAAVDASVDRSVISEQDTLTLTLSTDRLRTLSPDLSALESDFELLSQSQSVQTRITGSRQHSERRWTLVLAPKRSGDLIIPALALGNERTDPIRIKVEPARQPASNGISSVFLDAETEQSRVHLQQQLIYRVRLYYSQPIRDPFIKPPELNDALVLQLGEQKNYETRLQGRRYGVAEWSYAIFPHTSGELTIPPQTFTGKVVEGRRLLNQRTRFIRIQSPAVSVQVLPPPAAFPNAPWLPAESLQLTQRWSVDPTQLRVGEPITRTLTLQAHGLPASTLPPLHAALSSTLEGVKHYPEQPQLHEESDAQGVRASRQESIALVPTRAGVLTLPELRIPWWNTTTGQLEYATLPAQQITVLPAASTPATQFSGAAPTAAQMPPDMTAPSWLWLGISGFCALGWLLTGLLWLRERRTRVSPTVASAVSASPNERDAYRALARYCRQGDPHQARAALLQWAQQRWPDAPPGTLQALRQRHASAELAHALQALDAALYGPQAGRIKWQGEALLQAVESLRRAPRRPAASAAQLPPLYPDTSR